MNSSKSGDSSSKRGIIGRSMRTPDSDMVILDSDTYATVSFLSDIAVTRYLPGVMLTLYAPPSSHLTCCMRVSFWYMHMICLLYTSDAADEEDSVDLGGRRI